MIELKFYRDDEYVYINNPDGTTKRVTIEDFESAISGEGGGSDIQISFTGDISDTTNIIPISYNEIKNCILSGKAVRLIQAYEGDNSASYNVYTLYGIEDDEGTYYAYFNNGTIVYSITSDDPDADMHAE